MGVQLPGALLCSWGTAGLEQLQQLGRKQTQALPILLSIRGATLPLLAPGRPCPLLPHAIRR